jgi:hypothetical protein
MALSKEEHMDHFFYEFRANEKVQELMESGLRDQALHRSGAFNEQVSAGGMRLSLGLLIGLGIVVALMIR